MVNGFLTRESQNNLTATETQSITREFKESKMYVMLISNREHLNQIGCHINKAVVQKYLFSRRVFWCFHSEREVSVLCMFLKSYLFLWNWQQCNLFVNNGAGISVFYKIIPVICSANCCNTRCIVVKNKKDLQQLRRNRGRV